MQSKYLKVHSEWNSIKITRFHPLLKALARRRERRYAGLISKGLAKNTEKDKGLIQILRTPEKVNLKYEPSLHVCYI